MSTLNRHRSIEQLLLLWHSLDEDQRYDLINSDDITAVEVARLDRAGVLDWTPVLRS